MWTSHHLEQLSRPRQPLEGKYGPKKEKDKKLPLLHKLLIANIHAIPVKMRVRLLYFAVTAEVFKFCSFRTL